MPGTHVVQEEETKTTILQRVPKDVAEGVAAYLNGKNRNPACGAMARFILNRHGTQAAKDLVKEFNASSTPLRATSRLRAEARQDG